MSQNTTMSKKTGEASSLSGSASANSSRKIVMIAASLVLATGLLALFFNLVHETLGKTLLGIALGVVALSIILAYFNLLQLAGIITSAAAFLILTFFLVEGDGIHDATITAYAAVVILAGLLLGEAGVIIFGALTTLSLVGLAYAEYLGFLSNKYSGLFDISDVNTIWFLHLATSAIVYFLVRQLSGLANEARQGEKESAQANKELSTLRDILQERVDQRTENLAAQNVSLQAASRIANEILSASDIEKLLKISTDLIASEFGYDHVGTFLLNEKKNRSVLQAASSKSGKKMLNDRYELPVDEASLVGTVASGKSARIAFNQDSDTKFFKNPYLPNMQSEMALPLMIQNEVIGVVDIQSEKANAFMQSNIPIFQSLANQVALAIQNTRLIEEARTNLSQLELIIAEQSSVAWNKYLVEKSYGFVYTPVGIKPIKTAGIEMKKEGADVEEAEIPIALRGKNIGSISLQRPSRHWTKKEKALIVDVATQVGLAIENARLLSETREQANQEQLVSEVSSKLRETLDMDTVLKTAIEEIKKTFDLKEVEVRLVPPNEDKVN